MNYLNLIFKFEWSSGEFHFILKQSVISSLLKKATLDKDQLSNYRPISNLSLLSKIIERVVKSRLTHHLSSCLLKQRASILVPTITSIVNLSLSSGEFHHFFSERVINVWNAPVSYTHLTLPTNREV